MGVALFDEVWLSLGGVAQVDDDELWFLKRATTRYTVPLFKLHIPARMPYSNLS